MYWPEFEFAYCLDIPRLLPHVAAIEGYQEAASTRVLPPPWREQPTPDTEPQPDLPMEQQHDPQQIDLRKLQLLTRNADRARAWARRRFVPGSAPVSLADVLAMHRIVAEEAGIRYKNPGVLRNLGSQVVVGRRDVGIHVGAPETALPRLMDQYIQFVNSKNLLSLPAAIHALVAHFFFTAIHPFYDGNGRVSRLVSAGILFQRGYNGHGFYALSGYFYQNEIKYQTLLYQCLQRPLPFDLTAFVAFGMEGLAMELQGINSFVKVKLNRGAERTILTRALRKRAAARRQLLASA